MSRNGEVDLDLLGETRRFRLGIGDLEALQDATDVGPAEHLHRLFLGEEYTFRHAREVVRVGLIGGGLGVSEAYALARALEDIPTVQVIALATLIMTAGLEGATDERVSIRGSKATVELPNGKIAFADFYAAAAAMKLPSDDMRAMSLWQFAAYVAGHNKANDPNGVDPLSSAEEDALWNLVSQPPEDGGSRPL